MSAKSYLIAGPGAERDRANQAALAWDAAGGQDTFRAAFLYVIGTDPAVATHTACCGPIADDHAPAVRAAIEAYFPGWQMIEEADPAAALVQAGLAVVAVDPPR